MPRAQIPLFSSTSESGAYVANIQANNEEVYNAIPLVDETGRGPNVMVQFPGVGFASSSLRDINEAGATNGRAMISYADPNASREASLAIIIGNNLYTFDGSKAAPTTISSAIDTSRGYMSLINFQDAANSNLVWSNHRASTSSLGVYNPVTDVQSASAVIGSGFTAQTIGSPVSIAAMNRQIIGTDGRSWATSAPASTQIDTTNRLAQAESDPDIPLAVAVVGSELLVLGTRTIERYYNTGSGKPPFTRIQAGVLQYGLYSRNAFAVYKDKMYFMDRNGYPMVYQNGQVAKIASHYINTTLADLFQKTNYLEGPKVMALELYGQEVIVFQGLFQRASNGTWFDPGTFAYYPSSSFWGRLGADGGTSDSWQYVDVAYRGNLWYALHKDDNSVGVLQEEQFYDRASTTYNTMQVRTLSVDSGMLGADPYRWMYMSKLALHCKTNEDLTTKLTMRYSDNYGETWSTAKNPSVINNTVTGTREVAWYSLGRTKQRMFEFSFTGDTTTDYLSMHQAEIDFELGGS